MFCLGAPRNYFLFHFHCLKDVLKERLQVQRTSELTVPKLVQVIQSDGFRKLYKGYWVTLMTFGPYSSFYFLCYEKMRNFFSALESQTTDNLSFHEYLLSASISSGAAAFVTTPLDVVKTRFQVQRRISTINGVPQEQVYNSVMDGFRKIIKFEGYGALWKGLMARVAYNAPNAAIIMASCKYFFSMKHNVPDEWIKQKIKQ